MQLFISGCHTDAGKTMVSAALCEAFALDYFKLIQAGTPTDSNRVQNLSQKTKIHPCGIFLKTPASPHIAMQKENISYEGLKIPLPPSQNLLIESAGGLFTPLDSKFCMIDYLSASKLPTILIGRYYLGSINHILLSIEALKRRNIPLLGLIISGKQEDKMDSFIAQYTNIKIAHFKEFHSQSEFTQNAKALKDELLKKEILKG